MSHRRRAGWRTTSTSHLLGVLAMLGDLVACSTPGKGAAPTTELISVSVHEGTWLAFDLSPDHTQIAFDMLGQLWLMPAAGGVAHAVTDAVRDTAEDGDPAFSPDGKSLAFAGERAGHPGLWRLDVATGRVDRLTTAPESDDQPAWSPDGRTIAFVRQSAERQGDDVVGGAWLHLLDVASGKVRRLRLPHERFLQHPGSCVERGRSDDLPGRAAALLSGDGYRWRAVVGGRRQRDSLAGWRFHSGCPRSIPSPDGHNLAFVANDSAGRAQVWIRALPKGASRRLTDEAELTPRRLRWAGPDTLLFVSGGRFRRFAIASELDRGSAVRRDVAFPRKVTPLPARHFPAPGSLSRLEARRTGLGAGRVSCRDDSASPALDHPDSDRRAKGGRPAS